MPAVDHHGQPDACRAAKADDGLHRGARRAAGVDDVVHKDDGLSGDRRGELRRPHLRQIAELAQVVAVQRDIQRLDRRPDAAEALHEPGQLLGQRNAAPQDADEQNLLRLRIVLQYLMRQAAQGALKRGCIRDLNSLHGFPSRRAQKCPAAAQRQGIRIHSKAADGCTDPLRLSFASLSVSLYRS